MAIYGPASLPTSTADSPTSKSALTASFELVPANTTRVPGSYIFNNTNKIMYVAWGTTAATPGLNSTAVPIGGAIDFPHSFVGPVQAIWPSAATGNAVIHEFSQS